MKRSIAKLKASAQLRFPDDNKRQREYIDLHMAAASEHDESTYTIDASAFKALKADVVAKYGARPRLPSITSRPPEPIPEGFDVEQERRRASQGGCCGPP